MPIVTVTVAARRSASLTAALAEALHHRTVHTLHKAPELIAIAISYLDPADWFVAGHSLQERGMNSAFVDIRITDETNTKAEKAQFIAELYADLQALLGPLHEESYIHVHDVRAAAYGYGGRTQEARLHDRRAEPPLPRLSTAPRAAAAA
jgi:4-oxalocrotonate tautomerase